MSGKSHNNHILATFFTLLEKAKQHKNCAKYGRYVPVKYMEPNYENYSLDELIDAREHIDRTQYPKQYEHICTLIEDKTPKSARRKYIPEEVFRELYKEHNKETLSPWPLFRGALSGFVAVKTMQYFEWAMSQMVIGGIVFTVIYFTFLVLLNNFKYERFKEKFKADT
jgi:Flp pilus assembly protein TadB